METAQAVLKRLRAWATSPARTERDDARPRFILESHLIGVGVALTMAGTYLVMGLPVSACITLVLGLTISANLVLLRRGARPEHVALGTLWVVLMAFAAFVLVAVPFDATMYIWFGLISYAATGMLGGAVGRRWVIVTVGCAFVARVLAALQCITPSEVHTLAVPEMRALAVGVTMLLFVQRYDRERQLAVKNARSADRLKSRFLANMSHEIRTPLNGIMGLTQALLGTPLERAQRDDLELIHRSGVTLVSLLNDLLDVSKIEADKLTLEVRNFDLHRLLRDLAALFEPLARQKGVDFALESGNDLPAFVRGDDLRLMQVLRNLLSNAVKFTSRGQVCLCATRVPGSHVGHARLRFEVRDTGIGIPASALDRVFRGFEQADETTARRFGGTGLGLALSRNLVALMGSALEVETAPARGSRFWFELELAEADAAERSTPLEFSPSSPHPAEMRVLVVDDNAVNRQVAWRLVTKAGFEAVRASSGAEAIAAVAKERFLLVLMDCHMPEMNGLEATRAIRALDGPSRQTRIVALTAAAMPDELQACLDAGMNDTLVKPLNYRELLRVLDDARRDLGVLRVAS